MGPDDGVSIVTSGGESERLTLGGMDVALVAQSAGVEIIRHRFEPGMRWGLCPERDEQTLEAVVVVSGTLDWVDGAESGSLGAGDTMVAQPVRREVSMVARTPVHLLYVSSSPVFDSYRRQILQMQRLSTETAEAESKVGHPPNHCSRVADLAMRIGEHMNLKPEAMLAINYGAFLHDLGATKVPERILAKRGALTDREWKVVKLHPHWGQQIIVPTVLGVAAEVMRQHHERWDGSGYPEGRRGKETALEASVVGVVDSYVAMTTQRVYADARSPDAARDEIRQNRGVLYHPEVVDAFASVIEG